MENQEILFSIRENQRKKKDFPNLQGKLGKLKSFFVSFRSGDFLYTLSHIQLSVAMGKCYPFVNHSIQSF